MTVTLTIPDAAYRSMKQRLGTVSDKEFEAILSEAVTEVMKQRLEERLGRGVTVEEYLEILERAPDVDPPEEDRL